MITGLLFDLDDTLYPQSEWLAGAWTDVAARAASLGAPEARLHAALLAEARDGSDRGGIIDRALERAGCPELPVRPLVHAFRAHAPDSMACYTGVPSALARLRDRGRLGLVTDGDPRIQHAKLAALGLDDAFDVIVFADTLGRAHRKPDRAPFRLALDRLGTRAATTVFVGDRPGKDVVGAHACGMRAVRVRTGEYAHQPDVDGTWHTAPDAASACAWLLPRVGRAAVRA